MINLSALLLTAAIYLVISDAVITRRAYRRDPAELSTPKLRVTNDAVGVTIQIALLAWIFSYGTDGWTVFDYLFIALVTIDVLLRMAHAYLMNREIDRKEKIQ